MHNGNDSVAQGIPRPALHTLRVDCDQDYEFVLDLARTRGAVGHPLSRIIIGQIQDLDQASVFAPFVKKYRLTEWDDTLTLVREGDGVHVSDGIWEQWMTKKLPTRCLDDSESCLEGWKPRTWGIR